MRDAFAVRSAGGVPSSQDLGERRLEPLEEQDRQREQDERGAGQGAGGPSSRARFPRRSTLRYDVNSIVERVELHERARERDFSVSPVDELGPVDARREVEPDAEQVPRQVADVAVEDVDGAEAMIATGNVNRSCTSAMTGIVQRSRAMRGRCRTGASGAPAGSARTRSSAIPAITAAMGRTSFGKLICLISRSIDDDGADAVAHDRGEPLPGQDRPRRRTADSRAAAA